MARLGSRQIAGYYPTPPHLLPPIASTLRWPDSWPRPPQFLDPCAGEGVAIVRLRELWAPLDGPHHSRGEVTACELEAERAAALEEHLAGPRDQVLHGDAFRFLPSRFQGAAEARATVLYLNPPYDQDPEHGRLEQRFLARFTEILHPGDELRTEHERQANLLRLPQISHPDASGCPGTVKVLGPTRSFPARAKLDVELPVEVAEAVLRAIYGDADEMSPGATAGLTGSGGTGGPAQLALGVQVGR